MGNGGKRSAELPGEPASASKKRAVVNAPPTAPSATEGEPTGLQSSSGAAASQLPKRSNPSREAKTKSPIPPAPVPGHDLPEAVRHLSVIEQIIYRELRNLQKQKPGLTVPEDAAGLRRVYSNRA